ncbi:unnamed protein product [Timema podura]|uniref:G-protein coupled receptors family 3 profile domain-containing protein n=1 Tax=Timema podura TaxID=61482 RepID=A0ABN7NPV8_TIMPD|nr:unnamed protein product [Timema podura]
MSLISSCEHSIKKFGEAAMQNHIYIGRILEIPKHSRIIGDVVKKFLDESEANETIGLLLEPEEIYTIVQYLRNYKSNNNKLLLGTIGLNKNFLKLWKNVFNGGYLVEPHMAELPDFRNYFLNVLQSAQKNDNKLVKEYISTTYDCNWNNTKVNGKDDCSRLEIKQLAGKLQIDLEVTFVVKAVSAFSAAVFLVQAQLCNENPLNCSVSHTNLQQDILATLSQLSFTSQHDAPFELQGTTLHITHDGQLVSNKYIIYHIQNSGDVSVAGWYSNDQGLVLNHGYPSSQDLFASNTKKILFSQEKHGRGFEMDTPSKATINEFLNKDTVLESFQDAKVKDIPTSGLLNNEGSGVDARRVTPESSITRAWATVLVATAAVGTFIAMFMLIYVLIKICDGTLAGNQSLGILLLLGIMLIYACVVLYVLPGSEVKCMLRTILYPIALSLCYGILIIKVMQLRSLVLLGLGGRISYINQYIILFFIIMVQIVIVVQWYFTNRPQFRVDNEGSPYCYMPRIEFLLLHLYIAILLLISFVYGLTVLKIRRNYKEGRWVTLAAFLSLPVFAVWGLIYSLIPDRYVDSTVCVALLVLATIIIMAVFIPKMSTISKQSSHFKHKRMHMSDSVTTVFTTFSDFHNSSGVGTRKKMDHSFHPPQKLSTTMMDAYADNITKNPIYEVTSGAYP